MVFSADLWLPEGDVAEVLLLLAWGAALGLFGASVRPAWRVRLGALGCVLLVGILLNARWLEGQRGGVGSAPLVAREGHELLLLATQGRHVLEIERALYLYLERVIQGKPVRYVDDGEIKPRLLLTLSGASRVEAVPAILGLPPVQVLADRYPADSRRIVREPTESNVGIDYHFLAVRDPGDGADSFLVMNHQGVFLVLPDTVVEAELSRRFARPRTGGRE